MLDRSYHTSSIHVGLGEDEDEGDSDPSDSDDESQTAKQEVLPRKHARGNYFLMTSRNIST